MKKERKNDEKNADVSKKQMQKPTAVMIFFLSLKNSSKPAPITAPLVLKINDIKILFQNTKKNSKTINSNI